MFAGAGGVELDDVGESWFVRQTERALQAGEFGVQSAEERRVDGGAGCFSGRDGSGDRGASARDGGGDDFPQRVFQRREFAREVENDLGVAAVDHADLDGVAGAVRYALAAAETGHAFHGPE